MNCARFMYYVYITCVLNLLIVTFIDFIPNPFVKKWKEIWLINLSSIIIIITK